VYRPITSDIKDMPGNPNSGGWHHFYATFVDPRVRGYPEEAECNSRSDPHPITQCCLNVCDFPGDGLQVMGQVREVVEEGITQARDAFRDDHLIMHHRVYMPCTLSDTCVCYTLRGNR
jgi:hypothetical protein